MDVSTKMNKALEHLEQELASIRSDFAHPSLLENLPVTVYEQSLKLKDVASITTSNPQTLIVTAWDAANVSAIDKGLRNANLSLNPRIEGTKLYVPLPPMTTERRHELINIIKQRGEQAKITIRTLRRDANEEFKTAHKQGDRSDDILKKDLASTQKLTDQYIDKIETILKTKQASLAGGMTGRTS